MEKQKIYYFYILFSEENPLDIRYVGVTQVGIKKRFYQHKYCATHKNKRGLPVHKWMYSRYLKGDKIGYKQIDSCYESEWQERERYWISFYKKKGFKLMNIDKGGSGVITKEKRNIGSIQRSINAHKKPVIALYKNGQFFKEFDSVQSASKYFNLKSHTAIGNVLKGWSKSCSGFLWIYKKDYDPNKKYTYNPIQPKIIKVYQFNFDGALIKCWQSLEDFQRQKGYSANGVKSAIKNKKPYHNHYQSFENSINPNEYVSPYKYRITKANNNYYFNNQNSLCLFLGISIQTYYKYLNNNITTIKGYQIIL